jgi:2-polyprenyl-3-methyl-5-hydroxy-6-metoxy-1,4-benzoquinol methylase
MINNKIKYLAECSCFICNTNEVEIISNKDRAGNYLKTVICMGCGLVRHDPIPTRQELSDFYLNNYRKEYKNTVKPKKKHILRYGKWALERLDRFKNYIGTDTKILDIGSGSGEFVYLLNKMGYESTGLEPSLDYSKYCKESLNINIIQDSFENMNFKAGEFDVITLHHVLEHLQNPFEALSKFNSWLEKGNLLVIDVPNIDGINRAFGNLFHYAHIYNFSPATLIAVAKKAGFEVVENQNLNCTNLVFRKVAEPNAENFYEIKDNYTKIKKQLLEKTFSAHYTSAKPYSKLINKIKKYSNEKLKLIFLNSPRDILNKVYIENARILKSIPLLPSLFVW